VSNLDESNEGSSTALAIGVSIALLVVVLATGGFMMWKNVSKHSKSKHDAAPNDPKPATKSEAPEKSKPVLATSEVADNDGVELPKDGKNLPKEVEDAFEKPDAIIIAMIEEPADDKKAGDPASKTNKFSLASEPFSPTSSRSTTTAETEPKSPFRIDGIVESHAINLYLPKIPSSYPMEQDTRCIVEQDATHRSHLMEMDTRSDYRDTSSGCFFHFCR